MTDLSNYKEYEARFMKSHQITGYGIMGVTVHTPCPFCAAPDWNVFLVIDSEEAMAKDTKCEECGRSAKAIITKTDTTTSFEVVQTGGPDAPPWLPPIRRLPS